MSDLNQNFGELQKKLLGDRVDNALTLDAAAEVDPKKGLLAKELKAFIVACDTVLQAGREATTGRKSVADTKRALETAANGASKLSLGSISCSLETDDAGQITKININH